MYAYILSIGDELVSGLTTNTNSAWLAERLTALGITTSVHLTVGDDLTPVVSAIRQSLDALHQHGGGLLLITGGLGPTEDDLTRQALANALNEHLVEDPDAVLQIENWFKARGRIMSPSNRIQALRPHSANCIENTRGTAPGLHVQKDSVDIYVMPGVPGEMKEMFLQSVLPDLQENAAGSGGTVTMVTKINTFGLGESLLGERIKDLMDRSGGNANPKVGTTVHDGIVSVRIYATGLPTEAAAMTDRIRTAVTERLGTLVFGENEQSLEAAVAQLLLQNRRTIAVAESFTGGLLAKLLTDIPGSSAYFLRGWLTYSNQAKHDDLGVPLDLIEKHGAVSEPVARAMAEGARKFAHTDFALATTGIAGPDGGSAEKPVGTAWIALATPGTGGTIARKFIFPGDRHSVRLRASQMALALLRWKILGVQPPI